MTTNYYQKKLFLANVDKNDAIIGEVERWKAHAEGILHRGFTIILTFENKYLLQHRKHVAFDKVWDFTFSSHQLYQTHKLQSDSMAIYNSLEREWSLTQKDLETELEFLGKVYYKAKDPNSIYTEHEIDYIYKVQLKKLPKPNPDFAYGFELIDSISKLNEFSISYTLAPWVKAICRQIAL